MVILTSLLLLSGADSATAAAQARLLDRSAGSGLDAVTWSGGPDKDHILESAGNGLLAVDYDNDAWPDLYLVSAWQFGEDGSSKPHSNHLYRSRRDLRFQDVTAAAGVGTDAFGSGGCIGDYDADGLLDLYVTNLGRNILFRNNGDGTFTRVTEAAGIGSPGWSTGAVFFDADGDGNQDLYVAAYIDATVAQAQAAVRHRMWRGRVAVLDGPRGMPGASNRYFHNNGDGTFTEATAAVGLDALADRYSFGVVAFDHDGDGDIDLLVANDSQGNALYDNQGDGTFRELGAASGLGFNANGVEQGSMGLEVGDLDGDLLPEVVVTNFANDYYTLYRNLGGGLYLDASFDTGIAVPTFSPLGWGVLLFDVDLDADLDLFFSNGHLYVQVDEDPSLGETYRQPNQLMLNEQGVFHEALQAGDGMAVLQSSRGAISVDLDNDGDLDVVISNQDARPTLLENATQSASSWLLIELADTGGDRMALGARVEVVAGGVRQVRWIRSGGSYMSQGDLRAHFGLGEAAAVESVIITWPDGEVERIAALAANTIWRIVRGRAPARLEVRP